MTEFFDGEVQNRILSKNEDFREYDSGVPGRMD
jgi:hypothetical protein